MYYLLHPLLEIVFLLHHQNHPLNQHLEYHFLYHHLHHLLMLYLKNLNLNHYHQLLQQVLDLLRLLQLLLEKMLLKQVKLPQVMLLMD